MSAISFFFFVQGKSNSVTCLLSLQLNMASRLLLRAALKARPAIATNVRRAYLSAAPLRTTAYLPSLASTVPQLRSFSLTTPSFSNGEGNL